MIQPTFIVRKPEELIHNSTYIELDGLSHGSVFLKYEGFNAAGSIKLKTALHMIDQLEKSGRLVPGCEVIESSSGNLGVALSIICASRNYGFTCVTDMVATESSRNAIRATGGKVVIVTEPDENGGFLANRLRLIEQMCERDPSLVWVNQYANENNWKAHYETTAREIHHAFPHLDWLFVGTGTTGTLMGCIRYFNEHSPSARVVAVDAEGSITFGGKSGKRHIPGIGTSKMPQICDRTIVKRLYCVSEQNTVQECRYWAKRGFVFGGSTGTVLAATRAFGNQIKPSDVVVAISPDGGDKYLDSVYNDQWVAKNIDRRSQRELVYEV